MFCITYFLGNNLGHKGIYLIESLNIIFCSSFFLPFQKHQRSFLKSLCSFGCGICLWSFRSLLLSPLRFCSPIFKRIRLLLENLSGRPPLLYFFETRASCWLKTPPLLGPSLADVVVGLHLTARPSVGVGGHAESPAGRCWQSSRNNVILC